MADGFISQENTAVEQNEPVMLKIVPKSLDVLIINNLIFNFTVIIFVSNFKTNFN